MLCNLLLATAKLLNICSFAKHRVFTGDSQRWEGKPGPVLLGWDVGCSVQFCPKICPVHWWMGLPGRHCGLVIKGVGIGTSLFDLNP